jgi:hypothetical protein
MGIGKFTFILTFCAIAFMFYEKEQVVIANKIEVKPKISFYNSIMYEITQDGVTQVVQSKSALMYDKRDEFKETMIIAKSNKKYGNINTHTLYGDNIIKIGDELYLDGKVNLQLADGTDLKTEQLEYNIKTNIAKNSKPFILTKDKDILAGESLYFDPNTVHIIAQKTKFKIKVKDE